MLDCDFGVGIIRKGSPERPLSYSAEQVAALNYADLAADRERLLNLKPPAERPLSYSAEQVAALNYADLAADRERLLNLKPPAYLDEFLGSSSVI
ncbi:hypothetical protein [Mycobacterium haemophilum]|uniref:hypothetical protein n=1 Tax=Mycobacterium haemophilum TaxID=29311 RepID=UPI0021F31621|nr:hypothetical protein [Mycobacterium haemophilum]